MGRRSRPPRSASSRSRLALEAIELAHERFLGEAARLAQARIEHARDTGRTRGKARKRRANPVGNLGSRPPRARLLAVHALEKIGERRDSLAGARISKRQPDLERGRNLLSSKTRSKVTEQAGGIRSGNRHGGRRTGARGTSRLACRCRDNQAVRRLARRGPADLSETQGDAGVRGVSRTHLGQSCHAVGGNAEPLGERLGLGCRLELEHYAHHSARSDGTDELKQIFREFVDAAQHDGAYTGRQAPRKPLGKHGRGRRALDKPQILQRTSVALEGANDTPLRSRAGRTIGATFDVGKVEARRAGDHLNHAGGAEVLRRLLRRSWDLALRTPRGGRPLPPHAPRGSNPLAPYAPFFAVA